MKHIVTAYLCQNNHHLDVDCCTTISHIFAKGTTQALCTVRISHGRLYNLEFVLKFWLYKLSSLSQPFSPVFIITNNGLSITLKCFVCAPRDLRTQFGRQIPMEADVNLCKNSSVVLTAEDFVKFKSNMVFSSDMDIFAAMVVCRAYVTATKQNLQFLVVKPQNPRRVFKMLHNLCDALPALRGRKKPEAVQAKAALSEPPLEHLPCARVLGGRPEAGPEVTVLSQWSWPRVIHYAKLASLSLMLLLGGGILATVWMKQQ